MNISNTIIYRSIHLVITGFVAFLWTIPLLERGFKIDRIILDDTFYFLVWIIGAVLIFQAKYKKLGFILTGVPVLVLLVVKLFS